jgi:hypothetical protein
VAVTSADLALLKREGMNVETVHLLENRYSERVQVMCDNFEVFNFEFE